jgi:hypothetical protein
MLCLHRFKNLFLGKINLFDVFCKKPLEKQLAKTLPTSNHFYFDPIFDIIKN